MKGWAEPRRDTETGARLREFRREKGLSAKELGIKAAEILGRPTPISESAVRNQENGTNGIPPALFTAYAEALGVEPVALLFGKDWKPAEDKTPHARRAPVLAPVAYDWRPLRDRKPSLVDESQERIFITLPGFVGMPAVYAAPFDDVEGGPYQPGDILYFVQPEEGTVVDGSHIIAMCWPDKVDDPSWLPTHYTLAAVAIDGDRYALRPLSPKALDFPEGATGWTVEYLVVGFQRLKLSPRQRVFPINR